MPKAPQNCREFAALVKVVEHLRGPQGCPWDKEQNHQSLTQYCLEEAHELVEAIDNNDLSGMKEELGDLLLQVVLHCEISRQSQEFDIFDVIEGICEKMIRRHPHVFSDLDVSDSKEVLSNWDKIKAGEKKSKPKNVFDIPMNLSALIRSQKIGSKTNRVNFDWDNPQEVLAKVEEELGELKEAMASGTLEEQQSETGDLLFSVAQLARHLGFDAEQSLRKTNTRFETRFLKMKEIVESEGLDFSKMKNDELEVYWQKGKKALKSSTSL